MARAKARRKRVARRVPIKARRAPAGTTNRPRTKAAAEPLGLTIFTCKNSDFERLTPEHAVDFVSELLWAEARRVGLSTTAINISRWVDMPDGGVDAAIEAPATLPADSFLKRGTTAYQVKAGAVQPWNDSHVRKILFGEKKPEKKSLGESVAACFDAAGTYVLICTAADLPEPYRKRAIVLFKRRLANCGYRNAKVEVWSQNTLIGLMQRYPSLSLKVNGHLRSKFQTHHSWAQQDDMKKVFKSGAPQETLVATLQSELRRSDEAVHVRVVGEPGVGKTRLVLEATVAADLAPLVIYCDSAAKFRDSELMNEILRDDNDFTAILIVDECDQEARAYIWNKLKHCGPRLKLVSIHNERDDAGGNIVYTDVPLLAKDEILAIIHEYGVPKDKAERWAEFCSGSARVSHVIGWNLRNNPEDLLKSPDTVNIWDRYVVGGDDPQSQDVKERRTVLGHLGLFKRFGYTATVNVEAKAIASLVQAANPQITWAKFNETIRGLRRRKILQGEHTLYITPKALHIKLWADWWDNYGQGFDVQAFIGTLPGKLREWFYEMFKYAAESEAASRVVKDLLGENGPFRAGTYLEDAEGADFFLALAEANPEAALDCLKYTIGVWDKTKLLNFQEGRREVVWALERIAIWRDLFRDAAKLLLQLAEAETETWGNNASGIFTGLFSPGYGPVAPTEAPPEERFPVFEEALESASKERRLLALRAADTALETHGFTRVIGAEHQGLRKDPKLWMPATYGEVYAAYRRIWEALSVRLETLPEEERTQAIRILLSRARGLAMYPPLVEMVVDTLTTIVRKPYAARGAVIETVERIFHYDVKEMPPESRGRWHALRESLLGGDVRSLLDRYVALDLLEDRFDPDSQETDKAERPIQELATHLQRHPEELDRELSWLVTDAAKNGYRFGYALGGCDTNFSLLPQLLAALRAAGPRANAFFVGGYFRTLREKDCELWERTLDEVTQDEQLRVLVPELTWRSGMSDRAALRILRLGREGLVPASAFQMFAFGSVIRDLGEGVFGQWIEFLLSAGELEAVLVAVDLYHFYYNRKDAGHSLPRELTLRLLSAGPLFEKGDRRPHSDMKEYGWTEIAKAFVRQYPESSVQLAEVMLKYFGEDGTITGGFHSLPHTVLYEIVKRFPGEVWERIVKYLGPPVDARAYHITSWLRGEGFQARGDNGVLPLVPLGELWRWVDADIEKRAWYLASFVPKQLFRREGEVCLAREVLVRYGGREDVRRNLRANFGTEGWSGPASLHYEAKKERLLDFKKDETNANVKRWIDEYVKSLDKEVERARIEEERGH